VITTWLLAGILIGAIGRDLWPSVRSRTKPDRRDDHDRPRRRLR